jgi:hypothetical protein
MREIKVISIIVFLSAALVCAQQTQPPPQPAQSDTTATTQSQPAAAQNPAVPATKASEESLVIPKDAKVFVASMPDGYDQFLKEAIAKKKVPVTVVEKREDAEFEITGFSETQKAGTAKKLIMGSWHSRESASIKVANLKSGLIAFAYSYNNDNSAHGKRTSAESCAKHLKEKVESGK